MTPRKEERIKAALMLRQQGMKPVEIKKALNIKDWKTVWRIFHQYAGDYAVDVSASVQRIGERDLIDAWAKLRKLRTAEDHTVDNIMLDTRAGRAHTARQIEH